MWHKQEINIKRKIKSSFDPIKEWVADPVGYYLIRINDGKSIEVAVCNYDGKCETSVEGFYASEIYMTLIRENLVTRLDHAAYVAKELFKAECVIKYGGNYVQDSPLNLPFKIKHILSDES